MKPKYNYTKRYMVTEVDLKMTLHLIPQKMDFTSTNISHSWGRSRDVPPPEQCRSEGQCGEKK